MADQPYQFGDVVDGYRWTITGWEPVDAPERTVGIPRLLEKRYAATQEAQAREQAATQTLEPNPLVVDGAPVVVQDDPPVVVHDVAPADVPEPVDAELAVGFEAEPEAATEAERVAVTYVAEAGLSADAAVAPEPVAPAPTAAAHDDDNTAYTLDELLNRRIVAAPALAPEPRVDDAEPAVEVTREPWSGEDPVDEAVLRDAVGESIVDQPVVDELVAEEPMVEVVPDWDDVEAELDTELDTEQADDAVIDLTEDAAGGVPDSRADPEPGRHDARPASTRAWYGLGIEPVEEAAPLLAVDDDPDAPFAAALALGARRFAEDYQPSEIEIIARTAASAQQPVDAWSALAAEPIDDWTSAPTVMPPVEQLDPRALTYNATTLPAQAPAAEGRTTTTFEAPTPDPAPEPEPAPRVVTYTPEPPAGWYPGSG